MKATCYCGFGCEKGVDPMGDASSRHPQTGTPNVYSNHDFAIWQTDNGRPLSFWNNEKQCSWAVTFDDRAEYERWARMSLADQEAYLGFTWLHPDDRKAAHLEPVVIDERTGKLRPADPEKVKARNAARSFLLGYEGSDSFLLDVKDRITPPRRGRLTDKQVEAVLRAKERTEGRDQSTREWAEAHADVVVWLTDNAPSNDFAKSLLEGVVKYGHLTDRQLAAVEKSMKRSQAEQDNDDPVKGPGLFRHNGDIYKVQPARESARLYAKKLISAEDNDWEYARGAMGFLRESERLTMEEAEDFGKTHGWCMVCGRLLTNEESIDRGIGPVCAEKGWLA